MTKPTKKWEEDVFIKSRVHYFSKETYSRSDTIPEVHVFEYIVHPDNKKSDFSKKKRGKKK